MVEMPFTSPLAFEAGVRAPEGERSPAHWFVFRGDRLLIELGPPGGAPSDDLRVPVRAAWARLPGPEALQKYNNLLGSENLLPLYLGRLGSVPCWALEASAELAPPAGLSWEGLRTLFSVLEDAHFSLAGRALQLIDWDRSHRYCGRCGTPTERKADERVRVCPACQLAVYPRIAPAVMALIRRGSELLLGRSHHFPPGMYSALAGFVGPGETLEQCVEREVGEEVGVSVSRIRYFASQPWPFPHSLMIAFVCDWASGEICPQPEEIEAAAWFDVLHLPKLPSRISIARRLIDAVAQEMRGAK
jgi:NAD+ diphosphatase